MHQFIFLFIGKINENYEIDCFFNFELSTLSNFACADFRQSGV